MAKVSAMFWGLVQFRSSFTNHYDDLVELEAYDFGRELAHVVTLRRFES